MSDWQKVTEKLSKKSEQTIDNSIAQSKVKHAIRMNELYGEMSEVNMDSVLKGKAMLDEIEKLYT